MNTNKKCYFCPKTAKTIIISQHLLLPLCLEHEQQLESKVGTIKPLTTLFNI